MIIFKNNKGVLWTFVVLLGAAARGEKSDTCRASLAPPLVDFLQERNNDDDDRRGLLLESVWEKEPRLWRNVEGVDKLFSFEDAIAGAQAGLLNHASVAIADHAAQGKWVSEYAPSTKREHLRAALNRGTVFFNGAGLDYPALAALAGLVQQSFGLPTNVNVYVTEPGREVSVSPHTDAQNVLVFQTQGRKHWRVWAPPKRIPGKDPFGRGKQGDKIGPEELAEPLIDAWLEPGSILYVPIGFPHATSTTSSDGENTANGDTAEDSELSCHVTLGLDTYFYGLTFATLRALALGRAGLRDPINLFKLDDAANKKLFSPLPFGFLCPENLRDDAYGSAFENFVAARLLELNNEVAARSGVEPPPLGNDADVRECVNFLVNHWRAVSSASKYAGVEAPAKEGSLESVQAKLLRNSKNQQEEAAQKKLGAFAQTRR